LRKIIHSDFNKTRQLPRAGRLTQVNAYLLVIHDSDFAISTGLRGPDYFRAVLNLGVMS